MDFKSLGPLVGQLINAGAPALGGLLTLALTPEIGPFASMVGGGVTVLLPKIAEALGVPPDSSPETIAQTIAADPAAASAQLAALNEEHTFTLAQLKQSDDTAIAMQGQQVAVNTAEATNGSFFVAGWRPAMGWGLGAIVMCSFLLPYPVWLLQAATGYTVPPVPPLDPQALYMLAALLGVNTLARSWDKTKGVDTNRIGGTSATTVRKVVTSR